MEIELVAGCTFIEGLEQDWFVADVDDGEVHKR